MLIALWLVIAQLLGASSSLATTSGGSLRASGARAVVVRHAGNGTADGAAAGRDNADRDASLRDEGSRRAIAWLRAAHPLARVAAPRNDAPRSVPPTTAAEAQRGSIDTVLVATVRVRALETSHAVAARGALLAYFATAPPLQG